METALFIGEIQAAAVRAQRVIVTIVVLALAGVGLANLGYYHGSIDCIYGRDSRDAVAPYQTNHNFTVTGTLTAHAAITGRLAGDLKFQRNTQLRHT